MTQGEESARGEVGKPRSIIGRLERAGPYHAAAMLAVMLLALALRLYLLGEQSVWWDEGLAVWAARQEMLSIARWTSTDVHPPLYFWLLHGWRLLVGESAFGLRFLSVLAGVLIVSLVAAMGRSLGGKPTALAAAALAAGEPFLVWWSQEMRMYELAALLALLSITLVLRLTRAGHMPRRESLILWLAYIVFTAAALYTLYLAVLVIVVEAVYVTVWVAGQRERRRALPPWALAVGMSLALFSPWLFYAVGRMQGWSAARPFDGVQFVRLYVTLLGVGVSTNIESYTWPAILFAAVFAVAFAGLLVRRGGAQWARLGLLLACVVILPVAVFALTLSRAVFYTPNVEARYLLLFAPVAYVLLAWGLVSLGPRLGTIAALILGILAGVGLLAHYNGRYLADDYQTLTSTLRAYAQPGDAIILHSDSDWPVFAYHYDRDWTGVPYGEKTTAAAVASRLSGAIEGHAAAWLVVTPDALRIDPGGQVEGYLSQAMTRQTEYVVGDKRLVLFARTGEQRAAHMTAAATRLIDVDMGGGVTLAGYEQAVQRARPGDRVYGSVYWRGDACGATLPVEIVRAGGPALLRLAAPMCEQTGAGDVQRTLISFVVAPEWPAGAYDVRVGAIVLGRLTILPAQAPRGGNAAQISHPLQADFDGKIVLRGYDIEPSVPAALRPGEQVKVTLYWQAQQSLDRSYTVFVHLFGQTYNARSGNFLWGQHDGIPVAGTYPTTSWPAGLLVVDRHVLTIDAQAPSGDYVLEIGLYDAVVPPYPRLALRDQRGATVDDRVILQAVRVER